MSLLPVMWVQFAFYQTWLFERHGMVVGCMLMTF